MLKTIFSNATVTVTGTNGLLWTLFVKEQPLLIDMVVDEGLLAFSPICVPRFYKVSMFVSLSMTPQTHCSGKKN